LVQVQIEHSGPWSMTGTAVDKPAHQESLPIATLPVIESIPLALF
jgi:hypothetical protein